MISKVNTCGLQGVGGFPVEVEAYVSNGMIGFEIVGLPSAAVKESRDRIRAAITVSGLSFPYGKVTVNLSPADIRKEGTSYELAIAIALLSCKEPDRFADLSKTILLGELSLEGKLLPVRGVLGMVISAIENGFTSVILPVGNADECECIDGIHIYPAENLLQVYQHVTGLAPIAEHPHISYHQLLERKLDSADDLSYVKGQRVARKALEIAAAGGHNMLMVGVPGSSKTMLARCLPGILPPLTYEESLETTMIYSAAGQLMPNQSIMTERPFRAPHHNTSVPAMIGGGGNAHPGEVSLAHNGVLFLDELPEFQRTTLDSLRQPLEDGYVSITRASGQNRYPSHCMLVACMNPCPCGNLGSRTKQCRCTPTEIKRYLGKISGPMIDRIDIQVEMDALTVGEIEDTTPSECSTDVRKRVVRARAIQQNRYAGQEIYCNAQLNQAGIEKYCMLDDQGKQILSRAVECFGISMRTYGRIRKVARTIADLNEHEQISAQDIALAIQYRNVEGQYWR